MTELQTLPATTVTTASLVLDVAHMNNMMEFAKVMASGVATVPKHLQKNVGDCLAVVMQAVQWGMSPFVVAQKTHLVNGVLGYEAQLVAAVVNSSGAINGRLKVNYIGPWDEFKRKNFPKDMESQVGVSIYATFKGDTEPTILPVFFMSSIKVRNSPLWTVSPDQQMTYLGQKRWARVHQPEALLGVYTPDELYEKDITPQYEYSQQETVRVSPQDRFKMAAQDIDVTNDSPYTLDELIAQLSRAASSEDVKAVNALAKSLSDADQAEYAEALDSFRKMKKQQAEAKTEAPAVVEEVQPVIGDSSVDLSGEDEIPY